MRVVCVRHLPTAWNRINRLQGRHDTDILELDDMSRAAVRRNQFMLEDAGEFEAVLASSLKRTQQTANIYGFAYFRVDALLDELDFGRYEGCDRSLLARDVPDWTSDPRNVVLGESVLQLESRVHAFIEKYRHLSQLLVFGHGSWFRAFLSVVRHGDVRAMNMLWIDNNELFVVTA